MSFGATTKRPEEEAKPANIDSDQIASNEEGVVLPYFAGRNRLKSNYIAPAYSWDAKEVKVQVGKGTNSTVGYNYFSDLAALFALGPAQKLFMVIIDSTVAWKSDSGLALTGDSYTQVTIPKWGDMRLFRGTPAQIKDTWVLQPRGDRPDLGDYPDFDPRLPQTFPDSNASEANTPMLAGHYDVHPAYRHQILGTFKHFSFGQRDRTSAPNIELILERTPAWFTGETPLDVVDGGVTPAGPLFEWLTNPRYGGNRTEAELDVTSWVVTNAELAAAGVRLGVKLTDAKEGRSRVAELLEYFDGYLWMKDGKLALGWYQAGDIDPEELLQLTHADLLEEPQWRPETWLDVVTEVRVKHRERDQYFKDNVQKASDNTSRAISGRAAGRTLQRPWIITGQQALDYAVRYQRMFSIPNARAELRVRRSVGKQIKPGQRLVVNSETQGLSVICRVQGKTSPEDGAGGVVLDVEKERAAWPALYVSPEQPRDPDFLVQAVLIQRARVVELPLALKSSPSLQVAILAQRPDALITGFRVHLSLDGGTHYDLQANEVPFAVYGRIVDEAYSGSTADVDTATGMVVELLGVDIPRVVGQSDADRDDGRWLIWVDGEILSLGQVTALGSGKYRVFTRRGMFATTKAAHAIGANVWFAERASLVRLQNATWDVGETVRWKLQPHTLTEDLDLDECEPPLVYTFAGGAVVAPVNLSLSSYARLASNQVIEVHVLATWDAYDLLLSGYEVGIRRVGDSTDLTVYRTVRERRCDFNVAPATQYAVKVRAITAYGDTSAWTSEATITSSTDESFGVSGLQLKAGGSTFETPDAEFIWALNNTGIGASGQHPLLRDYRVKIYDLSGVPPYAVRREQYVTDQRYNYSQARNAEDGMLRGFGIGVAARSTAGAVSSEAFIVVSNPPPNPPSSGAIGVSLAGDVVTITPPTATEIDFTGYALRGLGEGGFPSYTPGDPAGGTLLALGRGPFVVRQAPGSTVYYALVLLDTFDGQATDSYSFTQFSVTNGSVPVPSPSIDPPSQTFSGTLTVSVSVPSGYTLRYTRDGSEVRPTSPEWPTASGSYTTLAITDSAHLRCRLYTTADGRAGAEVHRIYTSASSPGTSQVATPALAKTTRPGLAGSVSATCATSGSSIRYRINGGSWTTYSTPVSISSGALFEAQAQKSGLTDSEIAPYDNTNYYTGGGGGLEP